MTPRQRYDAALSGSTPDLLPRIPLLMQFAAEYIGSHYGAFASDHRVLVEANLRCAEDFGLEQVSTISDPYRETAGFGAEIRFHRDRVPECVRPPLADAVAGDDSPDRLVIPDPEGAPRMKDRLDALRLYRQRVDDHYSILGWVEGPAALAANLRGVSSFLMDLIDEPEWCGRLMDITAECAARFARAQLAAGADTIGIGDAICSQISGATYATLVWPRQLRLVNAIKSAGGRVRLHICGQTRHLWRWLRELPVDIVDCDHRVDLAAARAALPPQMIVAGNVDPVAALRFGEADQIRAQVRTCARVVGPRFMICAGCEVPSGTPAANLHALCEPLVPPPGPPPEGGG